MYYSKTIVNTELDQFCLMLKATIDNTTDYSSVILKIMEDSYNVIEHKKMFYEISSGYFNLVDLLCGEGIYKVVVKFVESQKQVRDLQWLLEQLKDVM